MSIVRTSILVLGIAVATAGAGNAHDVSDINRAQANQIQRIDQLRRTGQLTRREHNALMAEQARIAALEQNAQSDGYVSGREHRAIRQAQQEAATHISEDSHNGRINYWRAWKWNHGVRY